MDEIYEKVAFPLQKAFNSTYQGIEKAASNPELIKSIIEKKYADALIKLARETINLKEVEMSGLLKIYVPTSNGVEVIKKALAIDNKNVSIKYVSAPVYQINAFGINQEECRNKIRSSVEKIKAVIEKNQGYFEFQKK
jgi:translation initiation factor 2 alpha subunit (eIF-2alpha)